MESIASTAGARSQGLDLRHNDAQFHVLANLIVDKYSIPLKNGARSVVVTQQDKDQLDRMVSRDSFVDALQHRLPSCPQASLMPIHVVIRQCKALGLHREVHRNILYAPTGSLVPINDVEDLQTATNADRSVMTGDSESIARRQLLAELQEASRLMAESVTPEAAQFWRRHVVDLQTRLRAMHGSDNSTTERGDRADIGVIPQDVEAIMKKNEKLLASLKENSGYVPPVKSDTSADHTTSTELARAVVAEVTALEQSTHETAERADVEPQEVQIENKTLPIPVIPVTTPEEKPAPTPHYFARGVQSSTTDPYLQGLPMVDVVAPADLPAGYTFEAEIENRRFLATVPAGGVQKGETFSCYMRDLDTADGSTIPVGRWRDSLVALFKHGVAHPLLLNSFFCPLIALSQVMTRMGFDILGRPSNDVPRHGMWSTRGMVNLMVGFWALLNVIIFIWFQIKKKIGMAISAADITALVMVNFGMIGYTVFAAANTRGNIRERYMIPEYRFAGVEDKILSVFCLPCTVAQMGRHTASYESTAAVCCSDTGLPPDIQIGSSEESAAVYGI